MYLQYYSLAFFALFIFDVKNKYSWILLCVMCILLKVNSEFFSVDVDYRYFFRNGAILVAALLMLKSRSKTCLYQSVILCLFLLSNLLMLRSISFDNYFYVNYEAITYGLVFCQFIPVLQRPWCSFIGFCKDYISSYKDKRLAKES